MGASVSLRRESSSGITHCFFLVEVVVLHPGVDLAALLSSDDLPATIYFSFCLQNCFTTEVPQAEISWIG